MVDEVGGAHSECSCARAGATRIGRGGANRRAQLWLFEGLWCSYPLYGFGVAATTHVTSDHSSVFYAR